MHAFDRVTGGSRRSSRLEELEAELAAARQLIADQKQILEANLGQVRDDDPGEPDDLPEPELPPLRSSTHTAEVGPPIQLAAFGPPTAEVAGRVFAAAAQNGVIDPAEVPSTPTAVATPSVQQSPPPTEAPLRRPARAPLLWTIAILAGVSAAVLFGVNRLRPESATQHSTLRLAPITVSATTPTAATPSVAAPTDTAPAEALQKTARSLADSGPSLDPEPTQPAGTISRAAAAPRKPQSKVVSRPRHALHLAVDSVPVRPAENAVRPTPVPGPARPQPTRPLPIRQQTPRQQTFRPHRRALVRRASQPDGRSSEFDREARRHPEPGWNENDDKWLDRF